MVFKQVFNGLVEKPLTAVFLWAHKRNLEKNPQRALREYITLGEHDNAARVLAAGADPNKTFMRGINEESYLHLAAERADPKMIKLLLDAKADPNVTVGELAATPLMAVSTGSRLHTQLSQDIMETVNLLVAAGANINAKDVNGETALHHACIRAVAEVYLGLAKAGADIAVVNNDGQQPTELLGQKSDGRRHDIAMIAGYVQGINDGLELEVAIAEAAKVALMKEAENVETMRKIVVRSSPFKFKKP